MSENDDLRERALQRAESKIEEQVGRDVSLGKILKILDTREESLRNDVEQFLDFYSLHFPELVEEVDDREVVIDKLADNTERSELEAFQTLDTGKGSRLSDEDFEFLRKEAENLKRRFNRNKEIQEELERRAEDQAPNLSSLLGPVLASRIIVHAGGLEELAQEPASTVQVLGAEQALFRYLGGEGTPPKHGILFEHEFVSSLSEDQRGKMARFLANKTVIAARLDTYGDKKQGEQLFEQCRTKYEELKNQ